VADYVQANNDMKNLLNSTEIATLFLDKELNIRRFTDTITNIYKVRNTDIGRPITDLVTDLQYPEIIIDSKQVIKTLNFIEKSISTKDGRWFDVKIMPYRTLDDHIEGLVLTFNDVTKFKQVELELKEANDKLQKSDETRYRQLFKIAKEGILVIDAATGKVTDVNPYLVELLGQSKKQFIEKEIWSIGVFKKLIPSIDAFKKMVQEEFIHYDDLEIITADKKTIVLELIGDTYIADDKKTIQFLFRHSKNKD
jgi:two-component system CheB/CheR fusion protein